jgi:hypothetical protein
MKHSEILTKLNSLGVVVTPNERRSSIRMTEDQLVRFIQEFEPPAPWFTLFETRKLRIYWGRSEFFEDQLILDVDTISSSPETVREKFRYV